MAYQTNLQSFIRGFTHIYWLEGINVVLDTLVSKIENKNFKGTTSGVPDQLLPGKWDKWVRPDRFGKSSPESHDKRN